MNDNLDNDFKNRIREVFDNYEDASAHEGWERLRQKFPEEKPQKRIIGWWWYSAAAVLLVCLAIWFIRPETVSQQVGYHTHTKDAVKADTQLTEQHRIAQGKTKVNPSTTPLKEQTTVSTTSKSSVTDLSSSKTAEEINSAEKNAAGLQTIASNQHANVMRQANVSSALTKADFNFKKDATAAKTDKIIYNQPFQTGNDQVAAAKQDIATKQAAISKAGEPTFSKTNGIDSNAANKNAAIAANLQPSVAQPASVVVKQHPDAVLKMIADDKAKEMAKSSKKATEIVKQPKSVVLGVYAATYFNYAKGSNSELNVGAGFSSDFKITGNLKFSTGIAIAQNSLSYPNSTSVPEKANARALNAAVASSSSQSFFTVSNTSTTPVVKNYNASLIGLDIPLNIKYQFNSGKTDTYISAGISSGTYINEKYSSDYSYTNTLYSFNGLTNTATTVTTATQQTSTQQHFSSFDFAKTLNFSFGMGYPLGKRNRLVIEPFLKYPLDGLGSQDLRFGAGGVNLKLNFQGGKK